MPAKSGKPRHKPRHSGPLLSTSLDPPSGEDGDGTPDEEAYDGAVHECDQRPDDIREADSREASSSPPRLSAAEVAQLRAEVDMLQGRLATARFDHRGVASNGNDPAAALRLISWKHGSIRSMPPNTPPQPTSDPTLYS